MRIISGKYKSRRFKVPASFKARPTTDFARESLFNILNNTLDWENTNALDLFSGTGSIAFELASRGCPRVVSVEQKGQHHSFICSVIDKLETDEVCPLKMDAFKYLKSAFEKFDFIFADPPYHLKNIHKIPDLIFEKELLKPDGLFILEHGRNDDFSQHERFTHMRKYGNVHFSFFE